MRKAINFDIDTKKYEECTGKKAPLAYEEIKKFFYQNGFEHRQGSGYISKNDISDKRIAHIIASMSVKFDWLNDCVRTMDVTDIGKQHSLKDIISLTHIQKVRLKNKTVSISDRNFTQKNINDFER